METLSLAPADAASASSYSHLASPDEIAAASSPAQSSPPASPEPVSYSHLAGPDEIAAAKTPLVSEDETLAGQTFSKLDSSSVQDLAKDTSFRPVDVVSQFGHIVKPEQLDKLADIERQKHENGVTAASTFEGIKGAWEGIKQLGAGAIQIAKHTPSILRVAKTGLGGDVGQKLFGGEQTPEELQADTKNAAEVLSGIEAMGAGYGSTVRGLVRNAANKEAERSVAGLVGIPDSAFGGRMNADITRPSTFLKDVDWKQRLLDDAAIAGQHREITEAGGEVMNLLGGKEELAAQGIKVDPEVVSQLSAIEDPTLAAQFALPLLRGLSITGDAAKGFTIANGTKTVATAATKEAGDNFVASVGRAIAKTGKIVDSPKTLAAIGAYAGHAGGPVAAAIATAGLPAAGKVAGKLITWTGETLANPKISVPVLEAGKRAAEGAAQGALFSVPFAASGDLPEDQISTLGAGTLMGVAGATTGHAIGNAKMQAVRGVEYAVSKAFRDAPDANPTGVTPAYGTDARLDAAHAQSMAKLQQKDPATGNIINRVRNLLAGDAEVYYVPSSEFAKATGLADNAKLPEGVHLYGSGTPKILIREGGEESTFHEVGHVIASIMPDADKTSFYDSIKENYSPEQLADFKKDYEKSLPSTAPRLTNAGVIDEVGAELISGIIRGVPLDGTPLPIRQRALSIVGRLGESLGLYSTKSPTAPTTTGLDLQISPKAAKPAQDFVSDYLAGKSQPEIAAPPVIPKGFKPVSSNTITPEHQSVIDSLRKSPFPKIGVQAQQIAGKISRGEGLTPKEQSLWEAVTETAASTPKVEPTPEAPIQPRPAPVKPSDIQPFTKSTPPVIEPATTKNIRVTPAQQDIFSQRSQENGVEEAQKVASDDKANPDVLKRVNEIAGHMQSGNPVLEIEHLGIASQGDAAAPEGRTSRRATQEEGYKSLAELQQDNRANAPESIVDEHQKTFVPIRWTAQGGTPTLIAASLDKVIHNLHRAVSDMSEKASDLVPYETEDGKLTEKGWQQAVKDVQAYTANQANGFRGNGETLIRPREDVGASIPAENPGYTPTKLSEEKENFLNLIQGLNTPATARIQKGVKPGNIKAQEIALANSRKPEVPAGVTSEQIQKQQFKEPYKGFSVKETNPLRNELVKRGVNVKDLLEVTERLRAKDIKSVKPRPEIDFNAPVTDTIRAGFLPSREPVAEQTAEKLGLKFGGNLRGLWQFDVTDPKDGKPIRFAIKEGATEEQIKAKADAKLSEFAEGNGTRELNPDWRVSIHREPSIPNFPGYVQIDDISGGVNKWSKSPQTLRAEGYDVPDSLFEKVSTGRYKLGDLLEGKSEPLPQVQMRDLREKTQFQPVTTKTEKQAKGNDEVRSIAADYVREAGLPYAPHSGNQEINEPLAKRIASFYGSAKHEPTSPEVKASYDAFVQETKDQYRHLTSEGYKMEPWTKEGQPYKNSAEMSADIRDNKHLWYFPTEGGFGTGEAKAVHPLLDDSGVKVGNKTVPVNDLFRAVHDVFGHSAEGYEFGPRGELNAFKAHAAMYSEEARPAMAAETLGQNSWVNFGEHLRDESGNIAKKGEKDFVPLTDRPFAEQKATTLPKGMVDAVMQPRESEKQLIQTTPEFLPSKEPRAVKSAAIRDEEGNVFEGSMHLHAYEDAAKANNEGPFEDGFLTNDGEFLSREDALNRAAELGQIARNEDGNTGLESNSFKRQQRLLDSGYKVNPEGKLEFDTGVQFKPKRKDLKLTHFSPQENLKELDPEFHGTGLLGAERKRAANYPKLYPKRSYFGLPGYEKEQGLGNNRYSASVPKDSVYDFQADPDNLYPSSAEIEKAGYAPMDSGAKTTLYEKRIKDAGYKGYLNKAAKAVAMFDRTPVKSEGLQFQPGRAGLSINASDIQAKRAETAWKEDGTDSPFFKRWFGDSVIADKKGEPKLVYHGTSVPKDFDIFKAKEIGFHFGTKEQANEILERHEYQSGDSENQRVIPVYLRVENPLRVEGEGSWTAQRVQYAIRGLDGFSNEEVKSATTLEKLRTLIESKGYDGLVYKNAGEVKGLTELQKKLDAGKASQAEFEKLQATGDDSYIVWHPEQVKSAFNRGTFDNEALAMQFLPVTKTASSKAVPNEDIQAATKTGTLGASIGVKRDEFQKAGKWSSVVTNTE